MVRTTLADLFRRFVRGLVGALTQYGLIDEHRGERTAHLAFPRVLTGIARQSQRTVDIIMVGAAVGPLGIAGLALAAPYWSVAGGIGSSITNGAVGFISQRYGADRQELVDIAIKQTLWVMLATAVPLTVFVWVFAGSLINLLTTDSKMIGYGTAYLRVTSLGILFSFINKVAIRTLVSTGNSKIETIIRVSGALLNVILTGILVFGLGLGVVGAALGTVVTRMLVTVSFVWGFYRGHHPGIGRFPVRVDLYPHVDRELITQLVKVSLPLVFRRSAMRAAQFPLLAIVAQFGPIVVAAYGISRRAYTLMRAPNWGFSLAASSLVGQELGADDETTAEAYTKDIIRFATVVYLFIAVFVLVLARPIAFGFSQDPEVIASAVPFIRISAIATILYGIDGVMTGILRSGGDTWWPLYGRFVGLYVFTVPVAYLAIITPLGLFAIYFALLTEALVPSIVTTYRVSTGRWKAISQNYRPSKES